MSYTLGQDFNLCLSVVLLFPIGLYHWFFCLLKLQLGQTGIDGWGVELSMVLNKFQKVFNVCCTALSGQRIKQKRDSTLQLHLMRFEFCSPEIIYRYV